MNYENMKIFVCNTWIMKTGIYYFAIHYENFCLQNMNLKIWKYLFAIHELWKYLFAIHELRKQENICITWIMKTLKCLFAVHELWKYLFAMQELWKCPFETHELWK